MQRFVDALEKLAEIEESLPILLDLDPIRTKIYAELGKRYIESVEIKPSPPRQRNQSNKISH